MNLTILLLQESLPFHFQSVVSTTYIVFFSLVVLHAVEASIDSTIMEQTLTPTSWRPCSMLRQICSKAQGSYPTPLLRVMRRIFVVGRISRRTNMSQRGATWSSYMFPEAASLAPRQNSFAMKSATNLRDCHAWTSDPLETVRQNDGVGQSKWLENKPT